MSGDRFLSTLAALRLQLHSTKQEEEWDRTDLLSSSLLSSPLATSLQFQQHLDSSSSSLQQKEDEVKGQKSALLLSIDQILGAFNERKSVLSIVPEEIETSEDALMELCTQLTAGPSSSSSKDSTLMQSLQSQMSALQQLYSTRDYLSLLAKAEDLQLKAVKAEDSEDQVKSLSLLSDLTSLAKKAKALSENEKDSDLADLKAIGFLKSQQARCFAHLVAKRKERLSAALEEAGWPPAPAELALAGKASKSTPEEILLGSTTLKRRWKEMMRLQRQGEKLKILPICSARLSMLLDGDGDGDDDDDSSPLQPGSDNYQPLFATQCLLTPLLLRFYYHFDSSRSTNRLDKPEWYLSHMLNVLRTHANLFEPSRGPMAKLCGNKSSKTEAGIRFNLYAELLHGILRPLVLKVESSIPLLLENSRLLSHTIVQVVQFDQDLRQSLASAAYSSPIYLAESLLSNETVFEAWVQSERDFATQRMEEELESGNAWIVGEGEEIEEEGQEGSWAAMVQEGNNTIMDASSEEGASSVKMKTTRSARAVVGLLDGLSERYKGLPLLTHQLPFLLIQLSLLQGYAQRLERSLEAFESMSSAFTRTIPGAIAAGSSSGPDVGFQAETDMVRGLRGLGRLIKACLSALYLSQHLSALSSTSFYLELGTQVYSSREGQKALDEFKSWQGNEEEKELDKASLGELVRRGWRSGGRLASGVRPLGSGRSSSPSTQSSTPRASKLPDGTVSSMDVWENMQSRFDAVAVRAEKAMEKLVVSEVMEANRSYSHRSWDEEEEEEEAEDGSDDESKDNDGMPTASLLPSLSLLSMHLSHLIPSLPKVHSNSVYRSIANNISTSLVDRVILSGGSHRFSERGALQLRRDVMQGWMGVVADVAVSESNRMTTKSTALGRNPDAPWRYILDATLLLSLSSSTDDEGTVSLYQACNAAFEQQSDSKWKALRPTLKVDDRMDLRTIQEILRRRIECPW